MLAIPGDARHIIISCNYGTDWVDLFDNPVLGWLVDETAVTSLKVGDPVPPMNEFPVITGTMPPAAPANGAIISPQWVHQVDDDVYVPDAWRGSVVEFFTWLATNNGAQRKVRGNFRTSRLKGAMDVWSANNQALFNPTPF